MQKLVSPAMNTAMLENPITQDNLATLKKYGFGIIEPTVGMLACKDVGKGKLPDPEVLLDYIAMELAREKDARWCACHRDCRPDAGIPRSGAVSDEP